MGKMAISFYFIVYLFATYTSVYSVDPRIGALKVECRERYLSVSVNMVSGIEPAPYFEAIDASGLYPLTKQYAAVCGYTVDIQPLYSLVELRASYFSCHTDSQNEMFTFNFNLITLDNNGVESKHNIFRSCKPSLTWSPREVNCEENYMEVSVSTKGSCASKEDWNTILTAPGSESSDWQLMFKSEGEYSVPMNLSCARELGYAFEIRAERLIFRSPYGQPYSVSIEVDGMPVEVIHPILLNREGLIFRMADMVVACSLSESGYNGVSLVWEIPTTLTPLMGLTGLVTMEVGMGLDGQLLDQSVKSQRGYIMEMSDKKVIISIPNNAEGGYWKSFVLDNMCYGVYRIHLYFEHLFVDQDGVQTRLCFHNVMTTPLLPWVLFTINQTVFEEHLFSVYLGNVPYDMDLAAVNLNGQQFSIPDSTQTSFSINTIKQPNGTHDYILRVPFAEPEYFTTGVLQYTLDINYTLVSHPQEVPLNHQVTIVSQIMGVFPPAFAADCAEGGISFSYNHQPFDTLWEAGIGQYRLTQELAVQRGYTMNNDSRSLVLYVPLSTVGYTYEGITLRDFYGSFELLLRNIKTLEIQRSSAKRCHFDTTELIVCSPEGEMTVVVDMNMAIPGADPARMSLLDRSCRPKEVDSSRVLFKFLLNTCGTRVQTDDQFVTYENQMVFHMQYSPDYEPLITRDSDYTLVIKCIYPLHSVQRLVNHRIKSDMPGFGFMSQNNKSPLKNTPPEFDSNRLPGTLIRRTTSPVQNTPPPELDISRTKSSISNSLHGFLPTIQTKSAIQNQASPQLRHRVVNKVPELSTAKPTPTRQTLEEKRAEYIRVRYTPAVIPSF